MTEVFTEPSMEEYVKKKHILKYMIRSTRIIAAAGARANKIGLFQGHQDLQFIWVSAWAYYDKYSKPIPKDHLKYDLSTRFLTEMDSLPFTFDKLESMIDEWFMDNNLQDDPIRDLISEYFKQAELGKLKESLDQGEEIELPDLQKVVTVFQDSIAKPVDKNPFRTGKPSDFLKETVRIPIGIDFLDNMLGGGLLPGELCGFIMPSKGGKTTLVMQTVAECVMRKIHCAVFSFEQSLEGDLTLRMYVLSTRSDRTAWKDIENVPKEVMEKWSLAQPLWGEYLHFFDDWTKHDFPIHSPSEIFSVIEDLEAIGKKPDIILIDWWGECFRKMLAHQNVRSDFERRMKSQEWLHEIKSLTEKHRCRTLLFHQLAGAEAAKSSKHMATAHDAQENKNFPNMVDFCFVSTRKDSESRVKMKLDASRAAGNPEITLFLDGDHCRFTVKDSPDFDPSMFNPDAIGGAML